MMCGSEGVVSSFCRPVIVVCIPRVFRVRALRLWCVYFEVVAGIIGGGLVVEVSCGRFLGYL